MILLEPGNRILAETVAAQIRNEDDNGEDKKKRDPIDVRLCDFDDVNYRVQIEKGSDNMKVSMSMPYWNELEGKGQAALEENFGDMVTEAEQGFECSVNIDMNAIQGKEDEMIEKLKNLKSIVTGSVFNHYFKALAEGTSKGMDVLKFPLRNDTEVFFCPGDDRVTIVFAIEFAEHVDRVIGGIFMQEFVDARRRIRSAPPCNFSQVPPRELHQFGVKDSPDRDSHLGYLSFAVLKMHVNKPEKMAQVTNVLSNFRNYLQYHIKCSKSYFHSRMRARVKSLLQILNRAKISAEDGGKKKAIKTASGKRFVRS